MTPYTRLSVFTELAIRDRLRDRRNLRQFAVFHYIPPHSAEFCQTILPYIRIN
jgi:hypothetical protein